MKALHLNTPLLRAVPGLFSHPEVWLKMDALQPSASFKLRGIGRLVHRYPTLSVLVTDAQATGACARFADAQRMRVSLALLEQWGGA